MSKEFIQNKKNSESLTKAVRQYKQLSYLTTSKIADDFDIQYFKDYSLRNHYTDDLFLNWVKGALKDANFLSFVKYYQNPNPSASLIQNKIKEPLSRVFFSGDSHFNYVVNGKLEKCPYELEDGFEKDLFYAVLFNYNDVVVHDLSEANKPFREIVGIDKVVSIETDKKRIKKIAYTAKAVINSEEVYGYAYVDEEKYSFYNKEIELLTTNPHDLGFCPANFVSELGFDGNFVAKESFFSYQKGDLIQYCFLKTIQRMIDVNGTTPIVVRPKTTNITTASNDFDNRSGEPMSVDQIGSQVPKEMRQTKTGSSGRSILEAGSDIEVPVHVKEDGSVDMDFIKNLLTFHYTPVESLEFLEERIKKLESNILISAIGDASESKTPEGSKSDSEIRSVTVVSKQDKLRALSNAMTYCRKLSDMTMLSLAYGKDNVKVDVFYGSDFFLETEKDLYSMFQLAPNSVERNNILTRLSQTRSMFNKMKYNREFILYKLLPYSSDLDFEKALERQNIVSDEIFIFQTQFSYWIAKFESFYGNIVIFWDNLGEAKESEKIVVIRNLIIDLIIKNTNIKILNNGRETES